MRVVAGTHRGRRLEAPADDAVRPTTDRAREAMFNALGSLDAIEGARVLDLFAGSGALGIEALSRGAESVTFVELDREALSLVERNLAALDLTERADVVRADAVVWLRGDHGSFDIALIDPPYGRYDWHDLLGDLPADLAVLESADEPGLPQGWSDLRQRRYGATLITFAHRTCSVE